MPDQNENELRWIFAVIRRGLWLIIVGTLVPTIIALVVIPRLPPVYKSTATLLIGPAQDSKTNNIDFLMANERLAFTYSEILKGHPVLEAVIAKLGLVDSPGVLADKIAVEQPKNTQLIRVTVTDSTPAQVALIANTLVDEFNTYIYNLQSQRYNDYLANKQEKIQTVFKQIEQAQASYDAHSATQIAAEAELAQLEDQMAENRNQYRVLQQSYQDMELEVIQSTQKMNIVETAFVVGNKIEPLFTANVTILIDSSLVNKDTDPYGTLTSQRLALTYGKMLTGQPVLEAVIAKLALEDSLAGLASRVKVEPILGTQMLRLKVDDNDPTNAIVLANTIADVFIEKIRAQLAEPYSDRLTAIQKEIDRLTGNMAGIQTEIKAQTAAKIEAETEIASLVVLLAGYRNDYRILQQEYEQSRFNAAQAANSILVIEPAHVPKNPSQRTLLYIVLVITVSAATMLVIVLLVESLRGTTRSTEKINLKQTLNKMAKS